MDSKIYFSESEIIEHNRVATFKSKQSTNSVIDHLEKLTRQQRSVLKNIVQYKNKYNYLFNVGEEVSKPNQLKLNKIESKIIKENRRLDDLNKTFNFLVKRVSDYGKIKNQQKSKKEKEKEEYDRKNKLWNENTTLY